MLVAVNEIFIVPFTYPNGGFTNHLQSKGNIIIYFSSTYALCNIQQESNTFLQKHCEEGLGNKPEAYQVLDTLIFGKYLSIK